MRIQFTARSPTTPTLPTREEAIGSLGGRVGVGERNPGNEMSMNSYELSKIQQGPQFLLQGLWWQHSGAGGGKRQRRALEKAMEIASSGNESSPRRSRRLGARQPWPRLGRSGKPPGRGHPRPCRSTRFGGLQHPRTVLSRLDLSTGQRYLASLPGAWIGPRGCSLC